MAAFEACREDGFCCTFIILAFLLEYMHSRAMEQLLCLARYGQIILQEILIKDNNYKKIVFCFRALL